MNTSQVAGECPCTPGLSEVTRETKKLEVRTLPSRGPSCRHFLLRKIAGLLGQLMPECVFYYDQTLQ